MVAVPPRLCVYHVIVVVFNSFVPLHSCIVSPSSTGNLAISLHKLSLKCLPLVDTIFTSFLSSVNQFLVFKTRSKEMAKLYCKSLVLYVYQIFSLLLCDKCALGNFFRVVACIYEWIESYNYYSAHTILRHSLFQLLGEVVTWWVSIQCSAPLVQRLC